MNIKKNATVRLTSHYIDNLIMFSHFCLSAELFIFYLCFVSFVNHQCLKGSRRPVPINRAPSQADESMREMFPDCYCLCPCDSLKVLSEKSVSKWRWAHVDGC